MVIASPKMLQIVNHVNMELCGFQLLPEKWSETFKVFQLPLLLLTNPPPTNNLEKKKRLQILFMWDHSHHATIMCN